MKLLVIGAPKGDKRTPPNDDPIRLNNFLLGLVRGGICFDHYPNILSQCYHLADNYKLKFNTGSISYPDYEEIVDNLQKTRYDVIITTVSHVNYKGGKHGILSYAMRKLKYALEVNKRYLGGTLVTDWINAGIKLPPVVVLDYTDDPFIWPVDFDLLSNCSLYFKRELPFDRFLCFRLFSSKLRTEQLRSLAEKLRPIWISYDIDSINAYIDVGKITPYHERDIDLSLLYDPQSSYTRMRLLDGIPSLEGDKRRVVATRNGRLDKGEFYQVLRRSKISASPEGRGWDCNRHYEVMLCGALLFITRPSIELAFDFTDGENCVFVEKDLRNFERLVRYYLDNTTVSSAIAGNGYEFAKTFLGNDKLVEYVLGTTKQVIGGNII